MITESDYSECIGCKLAGGIKVLPGGIITLAGNWLTNIYPGSEGFLGWLVLYPRIHRRELAELTLDEVKTLGINIQALDRSLHRYWEKQFKDDYLERVYFVYFFDSVYGIQDGQERSDEAHLHIHLIPRPRSIGTLLRSYSTDGSIHAWSTYRVHEQQDFPERYRKSDQRLADLMEFLRADLDTRNTIAEAW